MQHRAPRVALEFTRWIAATARIFKGDGFASKTSNVRESPELAGNDTTNHQGMRRFNVEKVFGQSTRIVRFSLCRRDTMRCERTLSRRGTMYNSQ